jgi:hypothetical protein
MIVRHRMQYFPEGGGGIGGIAPAGAVGIAYAPGAPPGGAEEAGTYVAPVGDPDGTRAGGGGGGTLPSTCGSTNPHFVQKSAPSGASSPQWRHTATSGARLMGYITVRRAGETSVGRARHPGPRAL